MLGAYGVQVLVGAGFMSVDAAIEDALEPPPEVGQALPAAFMAASFGAGVLVFRYSNHHASRP